MKSGEISQNAAERNISLDLFRSMASIAVIGLHVFHGGIFLTDTAIYHLCGFAVPGFFLSSGYILLNRENITPYYVARKIYHWGKMIFIWSFIIFLTYVIQNMLQGRADPYALLLLPFTFAGALIQRGVLWHFWYFGAIAIVYCLSLFFIKKKNYLLYWIFFAAAGAAIQIASYFLETPIQKYCIQTFRLWTWLQYFLLGGMLGKRMLSNGKHYLPFKVHTVCLILVTALIPLYQNIIGYYLLHNTYAEFFYDSLFTVIWMILLFSWVMRLTCPPILKKAIQKLAPLTTGIYILHPLIMGVLSGYIVTAAFPSFLYFIVVLLLSVIFARLISAIPAARILIR